MNLESSGLLKVVLILCVIFVSQCQGRKKYNISFAQLSTCEEYDIKGTGYLYRDFFKVHTLNNTKLAPNERLHLKFYVMTAMDAHILLSVTDRPRIRDLIYEIVIGAGGNTFSAIRALMGNRRVATNQDPYLLSVYDPTPIEVIQLQDGNLLVYIPGFKEEPLLKYTDPAPLNINYISFSSYGAIQAKWFYDCPFDGFENEIEPEARIIPPLQRLIANITANARNRTVPLQVDSVDFSFQVCFVSYKHDTSILNTRMHLTMTWSDPDLRWNPSDFDGLKSISRTDLDIWTPQIVVFNGVLETFKHFSPYHEIKVDASGNVSWYAANAELKFWCLNRVENWPYEKLICDLYLGVSDFSSLGDGLIKLNYKGGRPLSDEPTYTSSEWQFQEIGVLEINNGVTNRVAEDGRLTFTEDDLVVAFILKRNSNFYRNVFLVPIFACQTLLVLSFFLNGYRRGGVILMVFVVVSLSLMFITKYAPPSYIPNPMVAYQRLMCITTFCYWLHIIILWLMTYPPKTKPSACVMSIITLSPLRLILCMRLTNAEEFVQVQQHPWRELGKMLNSVFFIVINGMFILYNVYLLGSD